MMTHFRLFCGLALVLLPSLTFGDDAISWTNNVDEAFAKAQRENKLVLIHFWHEQCGPCRRLESFVFQDGKVAAALDKDYVAVKVNTRQNPEIAEKYRINSVPQDLVFMPGGQIVSQRISPSNSRGYMFMLSQVVKSSGQPNAGADVAIARAIANNDPTEIPVVRTPDHRRQFPQAPQSRLSHSLSDQAQTTSNQLPADLQSGNRSVAGMDPRNQRPPSRAQVVSNPYVTHPDEPSETQSVAKVGFSQASGQSESTGVAKVGGGAFQPSGSGLPSQPSNVPGQAMPQSAARRPAVPQAAANVASRQVAESQPVQPKTPQIQPEKPASSEENLPQLGLEGFCPIALIVDKAWVEGDRRFGCIHRGQLYLFLSAESRDKFLQEPDRYAPILAGYDPVLFAEQGELVQGKREHGRFIDDRIVLFANEENFARFEKDPMRYILTVRQAMQESDQVRR